MPDVHEHDWRVDPSVLLMTHPPQQRLRCADCGAGATRPVASIYPAIDFNDVSTWPKA